MNTKQYACWKIKQTEQIIKNINFNKNSQKDINIELYLNGIICALTAITGGSKINSNHFSEYARGMHVANESIKAFEQSGNIQHLFTKLIIKNGEKQND